LWFSILDGITPASGQQKVRFDARTSAGPPQPIIERSSGQELKNSEYWCESLTQVAVLRAAVSSVIYNTDSNVFKLNDNPPQP